jgi:MATE family multidrug resistance protein
MRISTTSQTGARPAGFASIWRLAWPQILTMFLYFLIGLADVYVAGLLGRDVQASMGMLTQAMFFFMVLATAVANGTVAAVSQSLGAGRPARAMRYVGLSLLAGGTMALAILAFGLATRDLFMRLMQVPEVMQAAFGGILDVFLLLLPIHYLFIISNAVFRAKKQVMAPLMGWGLAAVVNVIGDFGLGLGLWGLPDMGYLGLAWSTFASIAAGLAFNLALLRREGFLSFSAIPPWRWIRRGFPYLFKVAWPSGLMQIVWHTGYLVLYAITASLPEGSVEALAGMAVGVRIESILFLPPMAFNFTASILVGHYLGADMPGEAKRTGYRVTLLGVALAVALGAALWPFLDQAAGLLTRDEAVRLQAVSYLRYNILAIPFTVSGIILIGALAGAGATLYNMAVTAPSIWLVRLPLALWLGHALLGRSEGVWMAMLASQAVQASAMLYVYHFKDWRRFAMPRTRPGGVPAVKTAPL